MIKLKCSSWGREGVVIMRKKCPYCGSELEMISTDEWLCPECGESFYCESKKSSISSSNNYSNYFNDDDDEEEDW